ncbi:MAG: hypothetical protein AAFX55_14970 [Bacteroidota bacterium]
MRKIYFNLAVFLFVFNSCTTNENIDWKKYDIITNIDELLEFYPDLNLDRSGNYERAYTSNFFDGTKELVYEYELLESETYDLLYYSITIETASSTSQGKESFNITKSAFLVGNKWSDMKLQEKDIDLEGDQNFYALRTYDNMPNGIFYITRRGTNVYSLIISGLYSSDDSIITDLINPEIKALESFKLK